MKRLKSSRGESIAEVLVSILIVSLIFLFLSEAVTASARINARIDTEDAAFLTSGNDLSLTFDLVLTTVGLATIVIGHDPECGGKAHQSRGGDGVLLLSERGGLKIPDRQRAGGGRGRRQWMRSVRPGGAGGALVWRRRCSSS